MTKEQITLSDSPSTEREDGLPKGDNSTSTQSIARESAQAVFETVDEGDFGKWFKGETVATPEGILSGSGVREVPGHITAMPCGCTRSENDGTAWSIEREPLDQFAQYRTSRVMQHSGCGKGIGEIPTPWACL